MGRVPCSRQRERAGRARRGGAGEVDSHEAARRGAVDVPRGCREAEASCPSSHSGCVQSRRGDGERGERGGDEASPPLPLSSSDPTPACQVSLLLPSRTPSTLARPPAPRPAPLPRPVALASFPRGKLGAPARHLASPLQRTLDPARRPGHSVTRLYRGGSRSRGGVSAGRVPTTQSGCAGTGSRHGHPRERLARRASELGGCRAGAGWAAARAGERASGGLDVLELARRRRAEEQRDLTQPPSCPPEHTADLVCLPSPPYPPSIRPQDSSTVRDRLPSPPDPTVPSLSTRLADSSSLHSRRWSTFPRPAVPTARASSAASTPRTRSPSTRLARRRSSLRASVVTTGSSPVRPVSLHHCEMSVASESR